jgi:hypothetical protein
MLMCWAGLILLAGPIPAIICVALLVLVVRRAVLCRADALRTVEPAVAASRRLEASQGMPRRAPS